MIELESVKSENGEYLLTDYFFYDDADNSVKVLPSSEAAKFQDCTTSPIQSNFILQFKLISNVLGVNYEEILV